MNRQSTYFLLFYFVLLCLWQQQLQSQENALFFKHFTIENGLSQNSIQAIEQDRAGFIWIATENGLNRFDGYQIKSFFPDFDNPSSIQSASVFDIKVDEQNRLWLATDAGVSCYDQNKEKFYPFPHTSTHFDNTTKIAVKKLLIDKQKHLWIVARNGLYKTSSPVNEYSPKKDTTSNCFKIKSINKNLKLFDIIQVNNNQFWIASGKGLIIVNANGNNITKKVLGNKVHNILKEISLTALIEDKNKQILIAGLDKLFIFDPRQKTIKEFIPHYRFGRINVFYKDKKQQVWIGTDTKGLFLYKNAQKKIQIKNNPGSYSSLSGNRISSIYIDNSNTLFVGDKLNGLNIAPISKKAFHTYRHNSVENSLAKNEIRSIYADRQGMIWIGLGSAGLNKFNPKNKQFSHYFLNKLTKNGLPPTIKTICAKNTTELYLSTVKNGLIVFNKTNKHYHTLIPENKLEADSFKFLFGLQKDSANNLWIGSWGGGLYKLDFKSKKFIHYHKGLVNRNITSLLIDNKQILWISTWGGSFSSLNLKTGIFTNYLQELKLLATSRFTSSLLKTDRILWIGTSTGLLSYDTKTKNIKLFNRKHGLFSEYIYDLQKDQSGKLWVSTNKGLYKFDPETQTFQNFDFRDNIQSNEFNMGSSCSTPTGWFYFGGIKGFTMFHPDSIKNSNFQAQINIINFYLFNKTVHPDSIYNKQVVLNQSINYTNQIQLNYKNNNFGFEFSSTDYSRPEKVQFKYRLKPYESNWNSTGHTKRFANYTEIKPGKYIFEVNTCNADGIWNTDIKSILITIEPAFWQTSWFKVLSALFLIAVFMLFYKLRLYGLKKQKAHLEFLVKEKTGELEQNMQMLTDQKNKLGETNALLEEKHEEITQQSEELRIISEKLKETNIDLELKVKKRTKKLKKALDDSKKAEKLIASFLSNMSHEIRTPMNAISGFSQLITLAEITDEQREEYNIIINQSVDSLLEQIDNIMHVSKMHSGNYVMKNTLFSLNDIFSETLMNFENRKEAQKTDVSLNWEQKATGNINIFSDKQVFKQIIHQLVSNALKYTEKGRVVFGYDIQVAEQGKAQTNVFKIADKNAQKTRTKLIIYVKDTGLGIDKKQQRYIFDAFKKIEGKEKLFRGTGLGLAIVKNLCNSINAKINLESELNKGSVFTVTFALSAK